MIRGTTPTHTFTFPDNVEEYEKVLITYSQANKIVIEKTKKDLTIDGNTASYRLSQEDTIKFNELNSVQIQVRIKFSDGTALASKIFSMPVSKILNDEVL